MKRHPSITAFLSRAALPVGAAALMFACKGPERDERASPVGIPEQAPLVVQWGDGPRKDNAEREIEKQAQHTAAGLFQAEPMAREPAPMPEPKVAPPAPEAPTPDKPSWADGVPKPADAGANDLPQGWPIEVRRGETPAVLAQWAGIDASELVKANEEALGNRKWFKVGDRITVTMSANDKVAFDRKREQFQKERVGQFFANRYFEKVIVYRVKKGEFIASAAKRYGDVPLWLIEEFNQMDFRGLQPGDEILIPVVGELPPGVRQPPPPVVVDEEGHPLTQERNEAVEPRLRSEIFAKARMALDDSNVFARPRPGADNVSMAPGGPGAPGPSGVQTPMVAPVQAAGYPRPEQALPPASIGGGLLPSYGGVAPANAPASLAVVPPPGGQIVSNGSNGQGVQPAAPAVKQTLRDVIVRRGESLMHYVMWSKTPLDQIKAANQGRLDTDRIFIGARIAIPMSDDQYVQFAAARAAWDKADNADDAGGKPGKDGKPQKAGKGDKTAAGGKSVVAGNGKSVVVKAGKPGDVAAKLDAVADPPAPAPAPAAPKGKRHVVKSGETATSIARAHHLTVKELKASNPGVDLKKLKIGEKLALPSKAK